MILNSLLTFAFVVSPEATQIILYSEEHYCKCSAANEAENNFHKLSNQELITKLQKYGVIYNFHESDLDDKMVNTLAKSLFFFIFGNGIDFPDRIVPKTLCEYLSGFKPLPGDFNLEELPKHEQMYEFSPPDIPKDLETIYAQFNEKEVSRLWSDVGKILHQIDPQILKEHERKTVIEFLEHRTFFFCARAYLMLASARSRIFVDHLDAFIFETVHNRPIILTIGASHTPYVKSRLALREDTIVQVFEEKDGPEMNAVLNKIYENLHINQFPLSHKFKFRESLGLASRREKSI